MFRTGQNPHNGFFGKRTKKLCNKKINSTQPTLKWRQCEKWRISRQRSATPGNNGVSFVYSDSLSMESRCFLPRYWFSRCEQRGRMWDHPWKCGKPIFVGCWGIRCLADRDEHGIPMFSPQSCGLSSFDFQKLHEVRRFLLHDWRKCPIFIFIYSWPRKWTDFSVLDCNISVLTCRIPG